MRFAVFDGDRLGVVQSEDGREVVIDISDLAPADPGPAGPLHRLIEAGVDTAAIKKRLDARPRLALADVTLCTPMPRPGKIVAAPVNYRDHQVEMAQENTVIELGVFLKAPSSVIGPGGTIYLPYADMRTDQEGEFALVIGKTARNVSVEEALDYVFGYTCALDITVRSSEDRSTRKSFDGFTPLGPWVVTPDEVGDPRDVSLKCWVNNELRQDANTRDLFFSAAEVIAYASAVMTLWPGDVVSTGTPAGVGPLSDGARVAVELGGIGRLEVNVSASRAVPYAERPVAGGKAHVPLVTA
jgi:2-keto-4-pentenoate hydratase/2-oxohepta-3-ene-1,7-dioic acid hydratase in catechol pathway